MARPTSVMALLAVAVLSQAAHAELIAADWKSAGDRLLMRDTVTRLEWLRVSRTLGQSYYAVTLRLNGGDLAGFSFATVAQVDGLFANAKASRPDGIRQLVDLWGPGRSGPWGLAWVSAITQTVPPQWPDSLWLAEAAYQTDPVAHPDIPSFADAMHGSIQRDASHRSVGSALTRVSLVPEPGSRLLHLLGLGAAFLVARRTHARVGNA